MWLSFTDYAHHIHTLQTLRTELSNKPNLHWTVPTPEKPKKHCESFDNGTEIETIPPKDSGYLQAENIHILPANTKIVALSNIFKKRASHNIKLKMAR